MTITTIAQTRNVNQNPSVGDETLLKIVEAIARFEKGAENGTVSRLAELDLTTTGRGIAEARAKGYITKWRSKWYGGHVVTESGRELLARAALENASVAPSLPAVRECVALVPISHYAVQLVTTPIGVSFWSSALSEHSSTFDGARWLVSFLEL